MQKQVLNIIKNVALECNIPYDDLLNLYKYHFKYIADKAIEYKDIMFDDDFFIKLHENELQLKFEIMDLYSIIFRKRAALKRKLLKYRRDKAKEKNERYKEDKED